MALLKSLGAPNRPRKLLIQPSANSPFCTSPSQLQEVTLDPDATANFSCVGMRSRGAFTGGRSVKEIDEQLSSLQKENFNLKLRIYFLEERMGTNFGSGKEDVMKKNIELQIELTNLEKELENKQELLCQAAKAMEIEEDENKKEICVRDQEIHDLKEMLEHIQLKLKNEREEIKQMALCAQAFVNVEESDSMEIIKKLQITIHDLQEELKKERERGEELNSVVEVAENVREKCETLENQIAEKNSRLLVLRSELEESDNKFNEYAKRIDELEEELLKNDALLDTTLANSLHKDVQLKDAKLRSEKIQQLHDNVLDERNKLEKKVEKYKWQCRLGEKRIDELTSHVDTLKCSIHNLELRLGASTEKRSSISENIASTEQELKSGNTDDSLFSVRSATRVPETFPKSMSAKVSSPVKSSPKSTHLQLSSPKSVSFKSEDGSQALNIDVQLSQEEVVELKKNHFKACKIIKTMIQKKKEYDVQIDNLQKLVNEKGEEIKVLKKKIVDGSEHKSTVAVEPKKSIKDKVSELNLTAGWNPTAAKENSMAEDSVSDLTEQYKELSNELEKKIEILSATLTEKDAQIERFEMDIQEKKNRIVDLEFELLTLAQGITRRMSDDEKANANGKNLLIEKDQQIQRLESELRKRTGDLQGIVNKELWEKNRSIEKLQTIIKGKDEAMYKLEKTNKNKELQLKIIKDRINELGIHINLPHDISSPSIDSGFDPEERKELLERIASLQRQLFNVPEHEGIKELEVEYDRLCVEFEKSEKLRQDSQEICAILNTRLEELCRFLQSLLKHKSILGFLGQQQSHKLREAINKSLEFSHTLSASILVDADQSLLQLTNITNLLNSTRNDNITFNNLTIEEDNSILSIIPSDITLTYRSHLNRSNNESDVITVLRQQIANLKHEIEVRDVELERVRNEPALKSDNAKLDISSTLTAEKLAVGNSTSTTLKKQNAGNQSESESWSEPDRSVSLARIGLQDESLKRPNNSLTRRKFEGEVSTESTADEKNYLKTTPKRSTLAESRQTIIALHEQICELEANLKQKENQLMTVQVAYYETDKLLKREQEKLQKVLSENAELEKKVESANKQYEDSDQDVKDLKMELTELSLKIKEADKDIEIAKLEKVESEQKIIELQTVIVTLEEFKRNVHLTYDIKNKQMQNTLNDMEVEKNKAMEATKCMEKALEHTKNTLKKVETELKDMHCREAEIRLELEENLQKSKESYNSKVKAIQHDLEQKTTEMRERYEKEYVAKIELDESQLQIAKLSQDLEQIQTIVRESTLKIRGLEEKICDLHKQLDNATLQYSELMLEKTKLKNDNSAFENEIQKAYEKESQLNKELNEVQANYKLQILQLEHQKLILESRISHLSKINNTNKALFSLSLPSHLNCDNGLLTMYRRQISDQSGYVSEEMHIEQGDGNYLNVHNALETIDDGDRLHATSSPDLGIESDQGRFSSLEANVNISRPLLASLEIAQTMNELLDPVDGASCTNEMCTIKTNQITNENVDLRKRLLRTRRALEDTLTRLTLANKQKKEVEKSICKQIHKTSQVLRKAKANLDSGSETDNIKS